MNGMWVHREAMTPDGTGPQELSIMRSYIVSYDLRAPGRNYQALYEAIKTQFSGACPLVESTWLIRSNKDAEGVRNVLMQHMDTNDAVVVFEWSGVAAWSGLRAEISTWIQQASAAA